MSGNQLKILALVAMTLDHIGVVMFPQALWLRIVGRLAFPIFAYMIAEGCFFTRRKGRYLAGIIALGVLCQAVFWVVASSLEQSILTTFALGILVIYSLQLLERWRDARGLLALVGALAFDALACLVLPGPLHALGYSVDYGLAGTLLPALCYLPRLGMSREDAATQPARTARMRRVATLACAAVGLVAVALGMRGFLGGVQWWGLAALVPLAFYDGTRGSWNMKYLFYVYYPLHLALIYGLAQLI